jgi:hypothetical protein
MNGDHAITALVVVSPRLIAANTSTEVAAAYEFMYRDANVFSRGSVVRMRTSYVGKGACSQSSLTAG